MGAFDIAIPIRRIDVLRHEVTAATCMRCGRPYESWVLLNGSLEQSCQCGLAYRVEVLNPEVVACNAGLPAANETPYWD